MSTALSGRSILITRPAHQAAHLCQMIDSLGGISLGFPTIEIVGIQHSRDYWHALTTQPWDIVIFISANAVHNAIKHLSACFSMEPKIAAIGAKTAATLQQQNVNVSLVPENGYTSEDLLRLPALQRLEQQRVLIVRGVGGRETLAQTLRSRGADVTYAEVYERRAPEHIDPNILELWKLGRVDAISITSNEGLNNLLSVAQSVSPEMLGIPLIVISQRQADHAHELGFTSIHITQASDEAILNKLISLWPT